MFSSRCASGHGHDGVVSDSPVVPACADTNLDGVVNVQDLNQVIVDWGECSPPPALCLGDVCHDGIVNVNDLNAVIVGWGACP